MAHTSVSFYYSYTPPGPVFPLFFLKIFSR